MFVNVFIAVREVFIERARIGAAKRALPDESPQDFLHSPQTGHASLDILHFPLGPAPCFLTGMASDLQEFPDLLQREPDLLGATNEVEAVDCVLRVIPDSSGWPRRLAQQPAALVIAHGLDVHAASAGEFADGQQTVDGLALSHQHSVARREIPVPRLSGHARP